MEQFFASGRAVDVVLLVLAVEAVWLNYRGWPLRSIIAALLPAVLMMIALRAALTGLAWPYISLPLALAFPVHLFDLHCRKMARAEKETRP